MSGADTGWLGIGREDPWKATLGTTPQQVGAMLEVANEGSEDLDVFVIAAALGLRIALKRAFAPGHYVVDGHNHRGLLQPWAPIQGPMRLLRWSVGERWGPTRNIGAAAILADHVLGAQAMWSVGMSEDGGGEAELPRRSIRATAPNPALALCLAVMRSMAR